MPQKLTDKEIIVAYERIKEYHLKYLENCGVKLPRLCTGSSFTKNALTLVFLSLGYPNTLVVSKGELTMFLRHYYPDTNDVQQARHLAAQAGFYILSGTRNDISKDEVPSGSYKLKTLEEPFPSFTNQHRNTEDLDFEGIKKLYNYRCATCGSKENEPNFNWLSSITKLQEGHMDPNKPLTMENIIPQCDKCNRPDRNRWVYDKKGRVIKVANPEVINMCDESVQFSIYGILYKKFKGKDPEKLK